MVLTIIELLLGAAALYCFVAWPYATLRFWRLQRMLGAQSPLVEHLRPAIANFTFRTGLCGILAAGLLGLIIR